MILEKLCITRNVNHYDREFYRLWTTKYNFGEDIIDFAIMKAQGKFQPMQYLNKILSTYNQNNVKTTLLSQITKKTTATVPKSKYNSYKNIVP